MSAIAPPPNRRLLPGDPAPSFVARTPANPQYTFSSAAGRYLALCFVGTATDPHARAAISAVLDRPDIFNDDHAALFVVSNDPQDEAQGRLANRTPGFRVIWDFDRTVAGLYGLEGAAAGTGVPFTRGYGMWVLIDPTLRVMSVIPFRADGSDIAEFIDAVATLPPPQRFAGPELQAPVLYLPRVLEPELCRTLIALYEADGGTESGFMREVDGRTVGMHDPGHKRRKDYNVTNSALISALQDRVRRRIVPEIAKVHQFAVTRMERYIVSCYAAEDGGHFAAHRDNTTAGTAHRRFAVSINLNVDFDGGEVSFPEYGPRSFKAPAGGAVVFSCSLLHRVSTVTRARRYAFLPFLYDDAAAQLRQRNAGLIGEAAPEQKPEQKTG